MGISLVPSTPHEGLTLLSTTTLSGASVTLSSIPQNYRNLQLIVRNYKPASDGTGLLMRINGDSGSNRHIYKSSWATTTSDVINGTSIFIVDNADNTVSTYSNIRIEIPDYTNATNGTHILANATANNQTTTNNINFWNVVGYYEQSAAVSSIDFFNFSGDFTSGTLLLYGVN